MSEPRIDLKNPWLAAILAFLIPGAGHLYQGRTFKGALYFVCIFGTFLYGMHLADWKAVYACAGQPDGRRQRVYGYFAQVGVGAPAMIALAQGYRYRDEDNRPVRSLDEPLAEPFTGAVVGHDGVLLEVTGQIQLKPVMGRFGPDVAGTFEGTVTGEGVEPQPVRLTLEGQFELEQPLSAESQRRLEIDIVERMEGPPQIEAGQDLRGYIPRSFWNWFEVPPEQAQIERLHRDLGRFFDLGMVFSWIAGLLNVLAIWDALEGPAYGYGDEEDEDSPGGEKDKPEPADEPASAETSADAQANGAPHDHPTGKPAHR